MQDTLSAVRDLEAAGIDPMHAEAIVGVIGKTHEQAATKADVADAVATSKADLAAAVATWRAELATAVATLEARIERAMNRNLLATIAVGGVILAAVKLL